MIDRTTKTVIKPLADPSGSGLDKEALKKACEQFEGLFLHQIMKGMRKTVVEGKLLHGGNAEKIFTDLKDQAVSDNLAQAGGLGMAEMLYRQLLGPEVRDGAERSGQTLKSYLDPLKKAEKCPAGQDSFVMPVEGRLSSGFGMRMHPILHKEIMHHGIDLAAPEGTEIKAAAPGRVTFSGRTNGYGNLIEVDHGNGLITRYGHNSKNLVKVGDMVRAGQVLGQVGSTGISTGPHLHFEVRRDGRPINPYVMLDKGKTLADKGSAKSEFHG